MFDEENIFRIYERILQFNNIKTNLTEKWAKALNRHFSKNGIKMPTSTLEGAPHHYSSGESK